MPKPEKFLKIQQRVQIQTNLCHRSSIGKKTSYPPSGNLLLCHSMFRMTPCSLRKEQDTAYNKYREYINMNKSL